VFFAVFNCSGKEIFSHLLIDKLTKAHKEIAKEKSANNPRQIRSATINK
tara:strand:- start:1521 stop:1667 length:147 start_codon:yes stop_codon:yes gene_type:complete